MLFIGKKRIELLLIAVDSFQRQLEDVRDQLTEVRATMRRWMARETKADQRAETKMRAADDHPELDPVSRKIIARRSMAPPLPTEEKS